ncbi:MAG: hypothetical protein CVV45_20860, partial [Spirochaetae bacterium HGW-Spirochaetae-10]
DLGLKENILFPVKSFEILSKIINHRTVIFKLFLQIEPVNKIRKIRKFSNAGNGGRLDADSARAVPLPLPAAIRPE